MVSVNISDTARQQLRNAASHLLDRRKQMCPWPFDVAETEQLYIPRHIWDVGDRIRTAHPKGKHLLNTSSGQTVRMLDVLPDKYTNPVVSIICTGHIWTFAGEVNACTGTELYPKFRSWVRKAAKIELEKETALAAFRLGMGACTTFKQLHKAMPEMCKGTLGYFSNQNDDANTYTMGNFAQRAGEITAELKNSSRAQSLPHAVRETLENARIISEPAFVQAMMMDNSGNISRAGSFHRSWVNVATKQNR